MVILVRKIFFDYISPEIFFVYFITLTIVYINNNICNIQKNDTNIANMLQLNKHA